MAKPDILSNESTSDPLKDFTSYEADSSPFLEDMSFSLLKLAGTVDKYYTPILFIFGTFGNCLSIAVFFTRTHKVRGGLSSSVYLSALAISDTGFLINLFILWLNNIGINLLTNAFMCPIVMYLGQVTGFLSVWFIVAFTVERFFAVCYPLSRHTRCTASRARKVTAGLTIFAAVAFSYVCMIAQVIQISSYNVEGDVENTTIIAPDKTDSNESLSMLSDSRVVFQPNPLQCNDSYQPNSSISLDRPDLLSSQVSIKETDEPLFVCTVPQKFMKISEISNYIDSVLTFIIPFVVIFCLNLKIIFCVKGFKGHREDLLASMRINHQNGLSHKSRSSYRAETRNLRASLTSRRNMREKRQQNKNGPNSCRELKSSHGTMNNIRRFPSYGSKIQRRVSENDLGDLTELSVGSDFQRQQSVGQITPPFKRILTKPSTTAMEIRVTKTLLLVSSVFLLLHFPAHCIRVASFIQSFGGSTNNLRNLFIAQMWANILFNTNFAVNFLLYCCSGKAFRHSVQCLLTCKQTNLSPRLTNTTTITTQINTELINKSSHYRQNTNCSKARGPEEVYL